jgi:uncharacterized membrane protein YsdA (DUF1294 family)/cold shock CspA family protein
MPAQRLGKVAQWHDGKGFGFIESLDDASGPRVFFHIRDFEQGGRRPEPGELVRFSPCQGDDGRPRAQRVRRAVQPKARSKAGTRAPSVRAASPTGRGPSPLVSFLVVALYAAALAWAIEGGRLPAPAMFGSAIASAVAFIAYWLDKHAAQGGRSRISESTLHLFELVGGWPGALLAQHVLRHKTRKASYRAAFWTVVALHCAALAAWVFRERLLG